MHLEFTRQHPLPYRKLTWCRRWCFCLATRRTWEGTSWTDYQVSSHPFQPHFTSLLPCLEWPRYWGWAHLVRLIHWNHLQNSQRPNAWRFCHSVQEIIFQYTVSAMKKRVSADFRDRSFTCEVTNANDGRPRDTLGKWIQYATSPIQFISSSISKKSGDGVEPCVVVGSPNLSEGATRLLHGSPSLPNHHNATYHRLCTTAAATAAGAESITTNPALERLLQITIWLLCYSYFFRSYYSPSNYVRRYDANLWATHVPKLATYLTTRITTAQKTISKIIRQRRSPFMCKPRAANTAPFPFR